MRTAAPLLALLPIAACATAPPPAPLCWRSLAPPTGDEDLGIAHTNPSLASNGADDVWFSWNDREARVLRWTRGQWSPIAMPVPPGAKAIGDPIVATGPNGAVVIGVRGSDKDARTLLHIARSGGGDDTAWEWLGPPLISSDVPFTHVESVALAMDAAGNPVVAWSEEIHVRFGGVFVARWDGSTWKRLLELHPAEPDYKLPLGVAVDGNDRVWLSWTEGSSIAARRLRVSRFDGSAWTDLGRADLDVLVSRGGRAAYPSLAVGRDGKAWLAWIARPLTPRASLTIAHWDGGGWSWVSPPDVPQGQAREVAMMLDNGGPAVGWSQRDESENLHLYLADLVGSHLWSVRLAGFHLVEGATNVGEIHLAPGPGGSRYVSWDERGKDQRRNRLMHAYACAAGETPAAPPKAAVERDTWPKTVDEAVRQIVSEMSPEYRAKVRATPEDKLILHLHGWGTGIRNSMGLWRGNTELLDSCGNGKRMHPESCSMEIIRAVWKLLRQTPAP